MDIWITWLLYRTGKEGELSLDGYENVSDSVKADVFGFDIADVGGSIRLFSEVMKRLEIKLDGDELYEEFQRIYDESVDRDTGKEKVEDKMWNRGRGRWFLCLFYKYGFDIVRCITDWKNQFKIELKWFKWYTKEVINSCDDTKGISNGNQIQQIMEKINRWKHDEDRP